MFSSLVKSFTLSSWRPRPRLKQRQSLASKQQSAVPSSLNFIFFSGCHSISHVYNATDPAPNFVEEIVVNTFISYDYQSIQNCHSHIHFEHRQFIDKCNNNPILRTLHKKKNCIYSISLQDIALGACARGR